MTAATEHRLARLRLRAGLPAALTGHTISDDGLLAKAHVARDAIAPSMNELLLKASGTEHTDEIAAETRYGRSFDCGD